VSVAAFERVTKRFRDVLALDALSLAIEPAELIALLGPNGAGKSTLVSLLLGLRRPDAGSVRLLGRDPRDHGARAAVGATLQELEFPATLRVRELVDFVAAHFPRGRNPHELLAEFGLDVVARRQAGGLSGGQRRRLGLALAFVGRPALIVLDEPTASLDGEGRAAVWRAVHAAREQGAAVLVATHDLAEAELVAHRVLLLDRGRLLVDGTVAAVKARAGVSRIRYRSRNGVVTLDVADPGAAVARLVAAGVPLHELEVRPLTLEEALAQVRR
jgi:ABC-2 type transport system ATP-binding protein